MGKTPVMDKTPIYPFTFGYAQEHDECEQYNASAKANIGCTAAIEDAIRENYSDNRLNAVSAVQKVVRLYGYDRMLYVLANSVQHMDYDGRISRQCKEWARTVPVVKEQEWSFIVSRCHPGLLNIFVQTALHEHLLSQPLKRADIKAEAAHILEQFQEAVEPNSPNRTHFMARVSADFLARAKAKDTDRLMSMLPFESLFLSTLDGYRGVYALISKDEDRSKPLILRKPSVRKKLREPTAPPRASDTAKAKEQER